PLEPHSFPTRRSSDLPGWIELLDLLGRDEVPEAGRRAAIDLFESPRDRDRSPGDGHLAEHRRNRLHHQYMFDGVIDGDIDINRRSEEHTSELQSPYDL